MISEPGVRCSYSARDKLRKSCVVEGPSTFFVTISVFSPTSGKSHGFGCMSAYRLHQNPH
jgi:hypothetical protein